MKNFRNQVILLTAFILSLFFESLFWQGSLGVIKPSFLLLTFIYWNVAIPDKIGLAYSFIFGFFFDLLNGNLLGIHSLAFMSVSFLSQRFFYQFRVMKKVQQSLGVFLLSLLVNLITLSNYLGGQYVAIEFSTFFYQGLINSFINALIWTPFFYISRADRRRFIL